MARCEKSEAHDAHPHQVGAKEGAGHGTLSFWCEGKGAPQASVQPAPPPEGAANTEPYKSQAFYKLNRLADELSETRPSRKRLLELSQWTLELAFTVSDFEAVEHDLTRAEQRARDAEAALDFVKRLSTGTLDYFDASADEALARIQRNARALLAAQQRPAKPQEGKP